MRALNTSWRLWERSITVFVAGCALATVVWLLLEEPDVTSHRWTLVPAVLLFVLWVTWILRPSSCGNRPCAWSDWRNKPAFDSTRPVDTVLPVCAHCKAVRPPVSCTDEDVSSWMEMEAYITRLTAVPISHGICPKCVAKHFPEVDSDDRTLS